MKEIAKSLGLPENATEAEIVNAIGKNKQSEQAAKDQADLINRTRAKTLIDNAIAAKKITEAERAEYDAMALSNYDMTAKVLEKIPGAKKVTDTINNSGKPKTEDGEPVSDFEALLKKGPAAVAAFKLENNSEYRRMWQAHYSAPYPEQEN